MHRRCPPPARFHDVEDLSRVPGSTKGPRTAGRSRRAEGARGPSACRALGRGRHRKAVAVVGGRAPDEALTLPVPSSAMTCWPTTPLGLTLRAHPLALLRGNSRATLPPLARPAAAGAWHASAHGRAGDDAATAGDRQRRHLRHPRGRRRHGQRRGLARCRRTPATRVARSTAAGGGRTTGIRPMACST